MKLGGAPVAAGGPLFYIPLQVVDPKGGDTVLFVSTGSALVKPGDVLDGFSSRAGGSCGISQFIEGFDMGVRCPWGPFVQQARGVFSPGHLVGTGAPCVGVAVGVGPSVHAPAGEGPFFICAEALASRFAPGLGL